MKKLLWLLSLLLLFLLSYLREVTFIGINSIIAGQEHNYANTELPEFLYGLSLNQLSKIKWILTLVFSAVFMVCTFFGIRLALNKSAALWTVIVYFFVVAIAVVTALIGLTFLDWKTVYPVIRLLVGIVHSPLVFLLISISYYSVITINKEKNQFFG